MVVVAATTLMTAHRGGTDMSLVSSSDGDSLPSLFFALPMGNHDLHALAVSEGFVEVHRSDTLQALLEAPDGAELLEWLRGRRMAYAEGDYLMVHAGVLPQWDVLQVLALAGEVEAVLREFFTNNDGDGWIHVRCEAEIAKMQDKQAKAKASAQASVNARSANAQRTLNERSTKVELPTPTPTPTPIERVKRTCRRL